MQTKKEFEEYQEKIRQEGDKRTLIKVKKVIKKHGKEWEHFLYPNIDEFCKELLQELEK